MYVMFACEHRWYLKTRDYIIREEAYKQCTSCLLVNLDGISKPETIYSEERFTSWVKAVFFGDSLKAILKSGIGSIQRIKLLIKTHDEDN